MYTEVACRTHPLQGVDCYFQPQNNCFNRPSDSGRGEQLRIADKCLESPTYWPGEQRSNGQRTAASFSRVLSSPFISARRIGEVIRCIQPIDLTICVHSQVLVVEPGRLCRMRPELARKLRPQPSVVLYGSAATCVPSLWPQAVFDAAIPSP